MTPADAVTRRRRWLWAGAAAAITALVVAGVVVARSGAEPGVGDGDQSVVAGDAPTDAPARAPQVAFERFDGPRARLDDCRGQPVVVNFWAS
jgi:hypothetical protein